MKNLTYRELKKFLEKLPSYDLLNQNVVVYDPYCGEYLPVGSVCIEENTDVLDTPHIVMKLPDWTDVKDESVCPDARDDIDWPLATKSGLISKEEFKIRLVNASAGCNIQDGWPCGTCFFSIDDSLDNSDWQATLFIRDGYTRAELDNLPEDIPGTLSKIYEFLQ